MAPELHLYIDSFNSIIFSLWWVCFDYVGKFPLVNFFP